MKRLVLAGLVVLAAVGFPSPPSPAEDGLQGSVTLGGAGVNLDDESFKFGEYGRIPDDGFYLVGGADLTYTHGVHYLDFTAVDAGLQSRNLRIEGGILGRYNLFADYDETIFRESNNAATPFNGAGGGDLTLPAGFVEGATISDMTTLEAGLRSVHLKQKRRQGTAGFSMMEKGVDFGLEFQREYKDGIQSIGGGVGATGGNGVSTILPQPVDYVTDQLKASIGHNGERAQVEFAYFLSVFKNREDTLSWENPWMVTSGDYQSPLPSNDTTARLALPPDNRAQRFSLSGGVNLPAATRVTALAEYGRMKQDESLLPYSTGTAAGLLPRDSAEARIDTTRLMLNVASRPVRKLALGAGYNYYRTDNKMPKELFQYITNDNVDGEQGTIDSGEAIYSLPYDYTKNRFNFDASYRVFRGTRFKAGYDYEKVDRDFREIATTQENTFRAGIQSGYFSMAQLNVDVSRGKRKAKDAYDTLSFFSEYHTQEYIDSLADGFEFLNHPDIRKFDIADRDRTKIGAGLTTFPHYTTTVAFFYNFIGDDYEHSDLGLQNQDIRIYTVDVTVTPVDAVSLSTFYTRENNGFSQVGRQFSGGGALTTQVFDATRNWKADHADINDTVGVTLLLKLMHDRLTLKTDYSFSQSNTAIRLKGGSGIDDPADSADDVVNLPDLKTKLQVLDFTARYRMTERIGLGLGYAYERYRSDDWQTDGVSPGSADIDGVIMLYGSTADYVAHTAMLFVTLEL